MKKTIYIVATILVWTTLVVVQGCAAKLREDNYYQKYIQLAEEHREVFELDDALAYYRKASDMQPENAEIYYQIGLIYGMKHTREGHGSIIGGAERLNRVVRREDSSYNLAVKYFKKAADLGHLEARSVKRALHNNIQHLDVKY